MLVFVKKKTVYEMPISDWSADVFSSDLSFNAQGQGVFVNMISLGGFAAAPFAAAYSASKFGLKGFSEALRAELLDHPEIHICDFYPSFVDTPALRHEIGRASCRERVCQYV